MISAFKDKDAVIEVQECDGTEELFIRLVIKNESDKFVFHLTQDQYKQIREGLKGSKNN